MGKVIRLLINASTIVACGAMSLFLLFCSDIAFSLEGLHPLIAILAIMLALFSALSLLPLVRPYLRHGKWGDLKCLGFVAGLAVVFLCVMSGVRQLRQSSGIDSLLHDSGNCTSLFSPLMRSAPVRHMISSEKPVLRYGEEVLQDACKVAELHQEFERQAPPICAPDEARDPDRCYRDVFDELMARDPLTTPGLSLAMTEGMLIALRDRGPRADSVSDRQERIVGQYRLASSTLGLIETVLKACNRHLAPGALLGAPAPSLREGAPEWEVMKILYRRNWLSDEDQTQILDQIDRKLDETLVRELYETARRISSKLERPRNSAVAVLIAPYEDQINHYNELIQQIHGNEEDNI